MTENIEFCLCSPGDYQIVADIYNRYILDGYHTFELETKTAEDIKSWIDAFDDRERLYILKRENKVVGWGIIKKYSQRGGYSRTCETAVYLAEGETGKGYGSFIKKELIKICDSLNYHHLVAKILAPNKGSVEYNKKLGYEIVGVQKEVGFKNGHWVDIVIMQYIINN